MTCSRDRVSALGLIVAFVISVACFQSLSEVSFAICVCVILLQFNRIFFDITSFEFVVFFSVLTLGLFGFLLAFVFGNESDAFLPSFKVFVGYPILLLGLTPVIKQLVCYEDFLKAVLISIVLILCFSFYVIIGKTFVDTVSTIVPLSTIPGSNFLLVEKVKTWATSFNNDIFDFFFAHFSYYQTRFVISSYHIEWLGILLPLVLLNLKWCGGRIDYVAFNILLLVSVLCIVYLSGKRSVWLYSACTIAFLLFDHLYFFIRQSSFKRLFDAALILGFISLSWMLFSVALDFYSQIDWTDARVHQALTLLTAFTEWPFGYGFGSVFPDVRYHYPVWSFELVNLKLLVDLGIVYLLFFLVFVLVVAQRVLRGLGVRSAGQSKPVGLSLLFIVAHGFINPTAMNFDGLFIFCLLVIYFSQGNSYQRASTRGHIE